METFKYNNGTYQGEAIDGVPHGKGRITWDSGVFYEGGFAHGKYRGKGVYLVSDYAYYEGEWLDGAFTGEGRITYMNGDIYEGSFVNGKLNGKGKVYLSTGEVLMGEWKDDELIK